ncbi:MAG: hypothetical protein GY713_04015 [Actinomycetia bacterium]|nr:hypothetical protein [Actinomycetes bacterium]
MRSHDAPPLPSPPEPPAAVWRDRFSPRTVVGLLVAAVAFDLAARNPIDSLAGFVLIATLALVGVWRHTGIGRVVVLSSLVPAAFLLVRDTPWLSTLNVWAALGLIAVGSTLRPEVDALRLGVSDLLRRFVRPISGIGLLPRLAIDLLDVVGLRRRSALARALPGLRGLVVALPFVMVLILLLAGADPLFASFFDVPFAGHEVVGHVYLIGLGLVVAGMVLAETARADGPKQAERRAILGAPEQIALLGGSALVYAGFLAAQLEAGELHPVGPDHRGPGTDGGRLHGGGRGGLSPVHPDRHECLQPRTGGGSWPSRAVPGRGCRSVVSDPVSGPGRP